MDTKKYETLVTERNKLKFIIDNGRKGTVYYNKAVEQYKIVQDSSSSISEMFRNKHNISKNARA